MSSKSGGKEEKVVSNEIKENKSRTSLKSDKKSTWFILTVAFVILVGILIKYFYPNGTIKAEDIVKRGGVIIDNDVFKVFELYDKNKDGYLEPVEFQSAFYHIKTTQISKTSDNEITSNFQNLEPINPDLRDVLANQNFADDEEILNIKTFLKPFELMSMKKFIDNPEFIEEDSVKFHLHGLHSWNKPYVNIANFSVSRFSIFLPPKSIDVNVNTTWEIIPKVLGNAGEHLPQARYFPPKFSNKHEETLYYLTSMFHPRAFLHMRFPPRGAVACIRAINEDYYDIMFRYHPEFQMNELPRYPYWFTVAAMVGNIVLKKDGSKIQYFEMHVPTDKKLNVDMEWMTNDKTETTQEDLESDEYAGAGQEVDIGYIEEMRLESTRSSFTKENYKLNESDKTINWQEEISYRDGLNILEKEFYPFKEIKYLPFNETLQKASSGDKLIHHILLWGSLDDQSC